MIDEIQVEDLALISHASLTPAAGLTVLTGETGAGKTALISALKLLMGGRASSDMVRDDSSELTVSGRFYDMSLMEDSKEALSEALVDPVSDVANSDEMIVIRKVTAEGRSRATLNGSMVSAGELAQIIAPSIDLCGQFEHQQLTKASAHLAMLDAWADETIRETRCAYITAFEQAEAAARTLDEVRNASQTTASKLDEARFVLKRIDEINPQVGEYEQLIHDLQIVEHAESLAHAVSDARAALSADDGALDSLNVAASALENVAAVDQDLAAMAQSLREAGYILEDVAAQVRDYSGAMEFDAEQLAFQQERLSSLQGLMRTYGPRMEDVFAQREAALRTISLVDDYDSHLQQAQKAYDEAEAILVQAADALDAIRLEHAPRFTEEVSSIMDRLQMNGARISFRMDRLPRESWTKKSPSSFEFMYRPVADAHPRPLAKIASGGEMSRVLLSVKTVLGTHDDVQTLVFDEVDAGVGGAVAVSLAELLVDLAHNHQVIVITHLAQVAALAQKHFVVRREGDTTTIESVHDEDRVHEIARMLSGSITETSLAHARELLAR